VYDVQVLEGRAYRLVNPWVGVVNRSQADINRNVDIVAARRKEREYFQSSPDYGHLASRMGSEYLAKLLSKVPRFSSLQLLASNMKEPFNHIPVELKFSYYFFCWYNSTVRRTWNCYFICCFIDAKVISKPLIYSKACKFVVSPVSDRLLVAAFGSGNQSSHSKHSIQY